jgi:chloride channel 3/4/5
MLIPWEGFQHHRYANCWSHYNTGADCVDWVQDAARTQVRRKARRQDRTGISQITGKSSLSRQIWDMYDAGQAWIVVTLVGMISSCIIQEMNADCLGIAIGLNAAFLSIVTEWLSDIKMGYCTTAFYLNQQFCCWGKESGRCIEAHILFILLMG